VTRARKEQRAAVATQHKLARAVERLE
jgi:hypothetical protein